MQGRVFGVFGRFVFDGSGAWGTGPENGERTRVYFPLTLSVP